MSKNEETGIFKLNKFQKTVIDISGKLQKFPPDVAGRQEFINFSAGNLYELRTTAELWRKYYKTFNYADVISVCCKYFREHVADEEND